MKRTSRIAIPLSIALAAGCGVNTGNPPPGPVAPVVLAVSPADGTTGVVPTTGIGIAFSRAMSGSSLTGNLSPGGCGGSVQLSADGFASCAAIAPIVVAGTAATAHASGLRAASTYQVRVTTAARSADGARLDAVFQSGGFTTRYFHTMTIDGVNEFGSGEKFTTSSTGYSGYVAWDANTVYLGMDGADVASASSTRWVLAYVAGSGGTATGVTYDTQTPALPFAAKVHLRWKADNTFTNAQVWNGAAWVNAAFTPAAYENGTHMEMSFPRAVVGTHLQLVLYMINELSGSEFSFAAVPSSAFTDAYDPALAHFYDFDLSASTLPAFYSPD